MNQSNLALARAKYNMLVARARVIKYKLLGLNIKSGVRLGKIICEWPKNITIGSNSEIHDGVDFRITHPFSKDNYIQIGERVFIGHSCEFNCTKSISIGNDCMIASRTSITDVGHQIGRDNLILNQPVIGEQVIINDDVWIGTGCIILKGVTIGKGSVIGAGSVVNRSIPEYQVWAGTPARFIKERI